MRKWKREREKKNKFKGLEFSVTRKKSPNVYKSCPKMISLEKLKSLTPLWEIRAKYLIPKALKSCTKSNKSPNLVTVLSEKRLLDK